MILDVVREIDEFVKNHCGEVLRYDEKVYSFFLKLYSVGQVVIERTPERNIGGVAAYYYGWESDEIETDSWDLPFNFTVGNVFYISTIISLEKQYSFRLVSEIRRRVKANPGVDRVYGAHLVNGGKAKLYLIIKSDVGVWRFKREEVQCEKRLNLPVEQ